MLQLRVFVAPPAVSDVADCLKEIPGSRHVIRTPDGGSDHALVTADLVEDAVDTALDQVKRLGVPSEDVALLRLDMIGSSTRPQRLATVVWADLLNQAGADSRPVARYLVFMATAGIIAAFGVIYANTTLVVGAMAISPDLLPITGAATALVLGRWRLSLAALATLVVGLGCACVVGGVMTFALHTLHLGPAKLEPRQGAFLAVLSSVNISTPLVAFAAGIAGMLAFETRATSAVGVAISVTTIPASAYLGVAAGVGDEAKARGALLVLGVNVAMLLIGGCSTLIAQRALARRAARHAEGKR